MSDQFDFGGEIVWQPTPEIIEHANLTDFMKRNQIRDYGELMERSSEDVAWFTQALLDYLDIRFYHPYQEILDLSRGIAWPQWCLGGSMNIVHNCLDKTIGTPVETRTAMIWEGEAGQTRTFTYGELYRMVNQVANLLRSSGLEKGDAVGLYMPMVPEVVIALLAIAKIGGIILPLFSGYGVDAIVSRLANAQAKALFTCDGFTRRGKLIAMKPVADQAAEQLPELKKVFVQKYADLDVPMFPGRDIWWHDLVPDQPETAETEQTSAEDVLMIIYTSGTTGQPKGAVHTHCGFPVKAAQDMAFGTDLHPSQVMYWMTDMGWMMGPWEVFGTSDSWWNILDLRRSPRLSWPGTHLAAG